MFASCRSVNTRGEVSDGVAVLRYGARASCLLGTFLGGLTGGKIYIAGLAATMTDVLVRTENLDGTTQVTLLTPSSPSCVVASAMTSTIPVHTINGK